MTRSQRWTVGVVIVLIGVGVAVELTKPFATVKAHGGGVGQSADSTGLQSVIRRDLSSQTEVPATLGYANSYTVAAPSGASPQEVALAQQTVAQDQQTLSADEQFEFDKSAADNQAIAAAHTDATSARSTATLDRDQDQAKVASDETKRAGDRATLASLMPSALNPGTTYTWLPAVGDVVEEDRRVYSVSDETVPLLYGTDPAYRAFYVGMSDGADVGQLTADLIDLGFGAGLTHRHQHHYSSATAAAVERWQHTLGLPATGAILLGQVVFEPGPIRVTSVTATIGSAVGSGGAIVLAATSTTRQVSIALDAGDQTEVAVGDKVTITLPNNATTPGVISSEGTIPSASGSSGPTITVLVRPTSPAATGTWDEAPVNVTITTGTVIDALVVPVDALLAQTGGGYAVEVVSADSIHRLVPVRLGLFDDTAGMVQITGGGLAAGQRVVVPNL